MPSIILRIRQQGYARSAGYQAVNWSVTVPDGTPLLGTQPLSFAPLFVVRNDGGLDSLARVATLQDLAALPIAELRYFDVLGPGGDAIFARDTITGAYAVRAGDVLTFPDTTGRLSYWLEDVAPYDSNVFRVRGVARRAGGFLPQLLVGGKLQLPGYALTDADIGRWVAIEGFATSGYAGTFQILSRVGNTAQINLNTTTNEIGTTWDLPVIEIQTLVGSGLEPRYFPTRELNLAWSIAGAVVTASADRGGVTSRWAGAPPGPLCRSVRYTSLEPHAESAAGLMALVRAGAEALQASATPDVSGFSTSVTSTYGP